MTAWFEWWNAVWGYDAEIVNVTGALAAVNLAGPRSRDALQRLTEADVSAEEFKYLDAHADRGRGRADARAADRLRRRARLRAPLPEPRRRAPVGRARRARDARPFGLEPQRVLRLEKGHVIVGQDTDSESNLFSAGMPWLPKLDKDDFVGQVGARALRAARREGAPRRLHDGGGRPPGRGRADRDRGVPRRARDERAAERGRRRRDRAGVGADGAIRAGNARRGRHRSAAARRAASRTARSSTRAASGCGREPRVPLAVPLLPRERSTSPLRRALEGADPAAVRDLSLDGVVELRGNIDAVDAGRR